MAVFRYRAVNTAGDVAIGELDAANEAEIVGRLRDQGLMPMQVTAATGGSAGPRAAARATSPGERRRWFARKTVSGDNVMTITRELAMLLRAGLPLDRALETLIGLSPTPPVAVLLQGIRDDVRGGKALSQALDARRDVFSRFYVNIVRAGEAGGALGNVMTRLADTMERNKELRESVITALIYPTILIGVAVASLMLILAYVVPQFQQTFTQAGKALPLSTQIVILIGTGLRQWWWAIAAVAFLLVGWMRRRLRNPAVRGVWDARFLRWPLVGDVVTKVEVARFARTLSTLLANGVTLLAGLGIVKETLGNSVLANSLDGVIARLREGKGFGRPLADTGLYPKLAVQMILVGEESGRLEEMLGRVADIYDREVAIAIKRFLAVLEPALILSLAVLILGIVLSILVGVMSMTDLVQ
jgi:general secretion pathway protein F